MTQKKSLTLGRAALIAGIVLALWAIVLPLLRVYNLNATMLDLGIYDNFSWRVAKYWEILHTMRGHFRPVTIIYGIFYKIFLSPYILVFLQWSAIFISSLFIMKTAKKIFNKDTGNFLFLLFWLNASVLNILFFDFHTDHLIILTFSVIFYLMLTIDKFRFPHKLTIFLLCVLSLGFKEPLILSVAMMGLTLVFYKKEKALGFSIFIGSLIFFYLLFYLIYPYLRGADITTEVLTGNYKNLNSDFSYLGSSVKDVIITTFTEPQKIIHGIFNDFQKLLYLIALFLPFIFLPIYSPIILLPALPAIIISLLSTNPNHYTVVHHYTAGVTPSLVFGFIIALKKMEHLNFNIRKLLFLSMLGCLIVAWAYAPLPIGRLFYKKGYNYHYSKFIPQDRNKKIKELAKTIIPKDDELRISVQNNLFYSYFTHRKTLNLFPRKIEKCDYVVVDSKREKFVWDEIKDKAYDNLLNELKQKWLIVGHYDGFYIFKSTYSTASDIK